MYLMRSILFLLTASIMLIAAPTRLVGVVLEAGSDRPVADVNILYMSGKKISSTDARGRFDIEVTSENTVLLVKKEGYDSLTVNVSEFPDFLDMVILVSTNVRDLGQSTVTVSYTHLRAHETPEHLVCRLLLEKKKKTNNTNKRILMIA